MSVSSQRRHMPQLDALRTFAVFAVMLHHFWPEATFNLPLGFVGVQLFFVLSGFLITGILWPAREAVLSGRWSARTIFQRFYIRRFLRIFPLFYGTLAILFLLGVPEVRDGLPWHVSYLSNDDQHTTRRNRRDFLSHLKNFPNERRSKKGGHYDRATAAVRVAKVRKAH